MKKISIFALAVASFLMFGCETNVAVESEVNPIGTYNLFDGEFTGEIAGTTAEVFKVTSVALEKDLGFMLTGQQTKNPTEQKVKARMRDDRLVIVSLSQVEPGLTAVNIEVEDSDLITCHNVFNAIARQAKKR